jgi:RNA polymerase sigma factor (sigma-70 family)
MGTNAVNRVIRHLRRAAFRQDGMGLTDAELLEHYLTRRDEAAFEGLVHRHGPMVLGVCRRILRNEADAEDAFQATFLVFVRKAASIRSRSTLSNWLYGVAHNTALKAKAMNCKRHLKEREAGTAPKHEARAEVWQKVQTLLDAELSGLPDKYRIPIVLCDLEGKTIKEAARHLGWPQGTVATRLTRGRAQLARRLTKHGLTLSGSVIAAMVVQGTTSAGVPASLVFSTVQTATAVAAGQTAATGIISAKVALLTERVVKTMLIAKLKALTVLLAAGIVLGTGGLTGYYSLAVEPQANKQEVLFVASALDDQKPKEARSEEAKDAESKEAQAKKKKAEANEAEAKEAEAKEAQAKKKKAEASEAEAKEAEAKEAYAKKKKAEANEAEAKEAEAKEAYAKKKKAEANEAEAKEAAAKEAQIKKKNAEKKAKEAKEKEAKEKENMERKAKEEEDKPQSGESI